MSESTEATETKPASDWTPIKKELRYFYFLPYIITAILSPSILIFVFNFNTSNFFYILSFYLMMGLIWPITIFAWPAPMLSLFRADQWTDLIIYSFAFVVPIVSFTMAYFNHRAYLTKKLGSKPSFLKMLDHYL
ncbi:MAG: hypothetical protein KAR35_04975 [Candidatus Heimdallarchaeota archaeon]|nr:hypothetical protein [Candidatus Heimdallarchaeota archaeon]MCK5048709.1 hypothetical protein [Candidatus Heimdallarchaeota archaeon]